MLHDGMHSSIVICRFVNTCLILVCLLCVWLVSCLVWLVLVSLVLCSSMYGFLVRGACVVCLVWCPLYGFLVWFVLVVLLCVLQPFFACGLNPGTA